MWEVLTQKLKALLVANTLIQEVYDYEVNDFNGQPAAVIVPSDNESNYASTAENERVYAFSLFLFVSRSDETYGDKKCDQILREIVDDVMNNLDANWQLTGLSLPTGHSMLYMEAAPSVWGYANREMVYRLAEIKVRIHTYVDINLIS